MTPRDHEGSPSAFRRRVLIVTPAARFGSWAWIEKAVELAEDVEVVVVSYGSSPSAPRNVRFVSVPAIVDYGRWGVAFAQRRFFLLNLLYYAPLVPVAWWTALRFRPHVLLANGVFATAILRPFRTRRRRLVLAFHGSIEHAGGFVHRVLSRVLAAVDTAFVNSPGSRDDLALAVPQARIQVIEHWADSAFFETPLERPASDVLRVVWVGRMDSEKFTQCLRVCTQLAREGAITLTTIGGGPLAGQVQGPGLTHLGYVADKHALAAHVGAADVAWGAADVTYVTIPGVEALAAGCPLLIPDVPAVFTHADAGQKVPRSIIPLEVGAVVDGKDDAEAIVLLRRWADDGILLDQRRACREYARAHHSDRNIQPLVAELTR